MPEAIFSPMQADAGSHIRPSVRPEKRNFCSSSLPSSLLSLSLSLILIGPLIGRPANLQVISKRQKEAPSILHTCVLKTDGHNVVVLEQRLYPLDYICLHATKETCFYILRSYGVQLRLFGKLTFPAVAAYTYSIEGG